MPEIPRALLHSEGASAHRGAQTSACGETEHMQKDSGTKELIM